MSRAPSKCTGIEEIGWEALLDGEGSKRKPMCGLLQEKSKERNGLLLKNMSGAAAVPSRTLL